MLALPVMGRFWASVFQGEDDPRPSRKCAQVRKPWLSRMVTGRMMALTGGLDCRAVQPRTGWTDGSHVGLQSIRP
jgi:hypothetical protein